MQLRQRSAVLAAALFAVAGKARAQTTFTAFLNGAQEVPSAATSATGTGTVVMNATRTSISVSVSFAGLTAPMTVAHIHGPAAFGVNAPALFNFGGLVTLTNGGLNGTVSNAMFAISAAQAIEFDAGRMYINVHSQNFPGGEIRGQLNVVPEPSSMFLMATGLGGLALMLRRRRLH